MSSIKTATKKVLGISSIREFKRVRFPQRIKFKVQAFGQHLEATLNQFVLKVENKGVYETGDFDDISPVYKDNFGLYISPDIVKKDFAYIEYDGDHGEKYGKDNEFEAVYNKALLIQESYDISGVVVNILIYKGFCFNLSKRYKSKANRAAFKSIELDVLTKKYEQGAKHTTHKGAEKAQALTAKVLGIKGQ